MRRRARKLQILGGLLALLAILAGTAIDTAQSFAREHLPAYISSRLSSVLKRPVAVGRVSFWPLGAFSLRDFRVLPGEGETEPPMVADRVRAYVSWWDLLAHRRLWVKALHVDRPEIRVSIDLRKPEQKRFNAPEELLSFYRIGLREIGIHAGSASVTTTLKNGEVQPVAARGLDFVAGLRPESFRYRASADEWSTGGLSASALMIRGTADRDRIVISESRARFEGGTLAADGTYVTDGGDVAMKVQVRELPVRGLAPQFGVPKDWDINGKLTGTVEVGARTGALNKVAGTLNVSPGSLARLQTTFPWTNATARIDWTPDRLALQNIDIQGNGLRLRGSANATGDAATPFVQRPFQASGAAEATSTEAITSLARLLSFRTPVPGQWSIARGTVAFEATGVVGKLAQSRASGRFHASGVTIRANEKSSPLALQTIEGDLQRGANRLDVRNLKVTADGLSARGTVSVTPGRRGRPGSFDTSARVDLTNLHILRQQLPDAEFWKWIEPAGPASRGQVTITARGPTANPRMVSGAGGFRFREFAATMPASPSTARWTVPIRELAGRMRLRGDRLALSAVTLRSDLFTGGGEGVLSELSSGAKASGAFRLASSRWQQLPPLQGRVPPGLSGGTLTAEVQVKNAGAPGGPVSPLSGTAALRGATYLAKVGGQTRAVALDHSRASFRLAGDRLVIPSYRVATPTFVTAGSATGRSQTLPNGAVQWLMRAGGRVTSGDAGALARWWAQKDVLRGGTLGARYVLDFPSAAPDRLAVSARVRLTDARPILPEGTLPFAPDEARIRSLTGTLTSKDGQVRFEDLVWDAPRFRLAGNGKLIGENVDGDFRLTTREWRTFAGELARALPVSGGALTVEGHVAGPIARFKSLPIDGSAAVRGLRLASAGRRTGLQGGTLDLRTGVRGTLEHLVAAELNGTFAARGVQLPPLRPGLPALVIDEARGRFRRSGSSVDVTNVVATTEGARLEGSGQLRNAGAASRTHRFSLRAHGPSIARLLPAIAPVAGKASGGRFSGSLEMAGTAANIVTRADGRAEVHGGSWTPPGQKTAMDIRMITAHFTRNGSAGKLVRADVRVVGGEASLTGTVDGLGTAGGSRHDLRLTWKLEDASAWASRFFPIPGVFTGGLFTGHATITGTGTRAAERASGALQVTGAGFLPPVRVLGGPVRPIDVRSAKGLFIREGGKVILSKLELDSSVGTATAHVVADDRWHAQIRGDAAIQRLEALVDLWPGFKDRVRGGRAEMKVALNGPLTEPRRLAGTIDVLGRDGVLTVSGVDALYGEQPFDTFGTQLVMPGSGAVRLEKIKMRGPRSNFDGRAEVAADGRVSARGDAWFTSRYTKKLFKPKILYPLASLVGLGRLKSRFEVNGTVNRAHLDLAITRSAVWRVAIKKKVPEDLRLIATGKAPLWSGEAPPTTRIAVR